MAQVKFSVYKKLASRDGAKCAVCGESLEKEMELLGRWYYVRKHAPAGNKNYCKRRKEIKINIDHIVPKSKGGLNEVSNYALTHPDCNLLKGDNTVEYARKKISSSTNNPA